MAKITVITRQRIFGHKPGSVIVVDDSPIIRGLLNRNRLDLVDPPSLEMLDGDPNSTEAGTDQELPEQPKRPRRSGSRKTSAERPAEGTGTVPGSNGGHEEFTADSADHTAGEAYSSSDS